MCLKYTQAVDGRQTCNTTACLFDGVDMHLFSLENIEGKCRVGAAEGKCRVGAAEAAEIGAL